MTSGPSMPRPLVWASMTVLVAMAAIAPANPALPQACTPELKAEPVVNSSLDALAVGLRWCGLIGAPAVDDPTLVGETSFKDMLWRRHERASECIWIPQCRITLRSAAGIVKDDYQQIADIDDPLIDDDVPGDVVVRIIDGDEVTRDYSELRQLWQNCDLAWGEQEKGLLALSIGEFIGRDGNSRADVGVAGVALNYDDLSDPDNVLERPAFAVQDPTLLADPNTERTLGHEIGHKVGICHPDQSCSTADVATGTIMDSGADGSILLNEEQCMVARNTVENSTQLDPPAGTGEVLGLIDGRGDPDEANIPDLMDIRKLVAVDDTEKGEGLTLALRLQGALGANQVLFVIGLDVDNDITTGAPLAPLVPGSAMQGVDVALLVQANQNGAGAAQVRRAIGGSLQIVNVPGVTADAFTVTVFEHGEGALPPEPLASDIIFSLTTGALADLDLDTLSGRLFPDGLAVQAAGVVTLGDGEEFVDLGPDAVARLGFPDPDFPSIDVSGPVCAGDTLDVEVDGLAPWREVALYLGETRINPGVVTDGDGAAAFAVTVPADAVAGPTLLTVGVVDPTNAVTADTIIDLCPEGDGDGRRLYPAKVVCGAHRIPDDPNIVAGRYTTTVNVFNPGPRSAVLRKTLSLAVPPGGERPGKTFLIAEREVLPAGRSMAVQCRELQSVADVGPGGYLDGFVVIRSSDPLRVTAVYSATAPNGQGGPAIDVVEVSPQ